MSGRPSCARFGTGRLPEGDFPLGGPKSAGKRRLRPRPGFGTVRTLQRIVASSGKPVGVTDPRVRYVRRAAADPIGFPRSSRSGRGKPRQGFRGSVRNRRCVAFPSWFSDRFRSSQPKRRVSTVSSTSRRTAVDGCWSTSGPRPCLPGDFPWRREGVVGTLPRPPALAVRCWLSGGGNRSCVSEVPAPDWQAKPFPASRSTFVGWLCHWTPHRAIPPTRRFRTVRVRTR